MKRKLAISFLMGGLFLSGCSGLKNIQDISYISALGMDYDEEKKEYTVYLQGLSFANIAKQEGGKPSEPIPVFVGKAKGETLNLAVRELYRKSEPPLFFGHVSTFVLSKNILMHDFEGVIKEVGRNRSIRHSLKVMTTEEDIEEVFNINALFDYPALYTVLYKRHETELYQDEIKPMTLMLFLRDYYEPMRVAKLPEIKIDKKSWKADKVYPVLFFKGISTFQQEQYRESISLDDSIFIEWLLDKAVSINHKVEDNGELVAALKLSSPKMKVKYEKGTTSPKFSIEISVSADLLEKVKNVPKKKVESLIAEEIKKNVIAIYNIGVENQTDLLNVGEKWYRGHPKKYQEIKKTKAFYLEKDSLKNVKVKVEVFHFNSYHYD